MGWTLTRSAPNSSITGLVFRDSAVEKPTGPRLGVTACVIELRNIEDNMNALVKLEPIPLPDLRKPTAMPSLPVWLATQHAALATNLQLALDPTGRQVFADRTTLPASIMPSETQRLEIARHCSILEQTLHETPENGDKWAQETMATVTKMLLVLGGAKASELAAEAKAEAYNEALEDIPAWSVVATAKRWYRGDCGKDEHGQPYDYRFMPDPATVRRLALSDTFRVRNRIAELDRVLMAVPLVDCSADLKRGRAAWDGLRMTMKDPEALKGLTFEKAVELGSATEPTPKGGANA